MNSENQNCCSKCSGKVAWAAAVVGAILIVAFLDHELKKYTAAPPIDAGRAEERAKTLAEIRNTEADTLDHTGWIDPTKNLVRLKIEDAMKLTEQAWKKDPAKARADLIARVEKANPPPPPPPPQKKSEFE